MRTLLYLGSVVVLGLLGCRVPASTKPDSQGGAAPKVVDSNILRADYAGSAACQSCHPQVYAQWERSPMHRMTRRITNAEIHAPFQGGVFHFKNDTVRLSQEGESRFLRIESPAFGDHLFRITKVIGGHHREDFAGVEVGGSPEQRVLPISYMLSSGTLRYKGYSVMSPERPGLKPGAVWQKTCILCHNTAPYFLSLFGALSGPKTPPYQGEVVDPLLPPERRQTLVITDDSKLRSALQQELSHLRGNPVELPAERSLSELLQGAVRTTRGALAESHLIEVGIGCESCHGGSRAHVQHAATLPSYSPHSAFLTTQPTLNRAQEINRTCARCHQVLFSRYPFTWEGGLRGHNPGGSNINSGEARDMMLGGCASQMSCVACHDPHAPDNSRRILELEGVAGDAVCLGCHKKYSTAEAQRAHSHHDPQGKGGRCMACHMPLKNMSLEGKRTRYHRVGSPTDSVRVLGDRPLECALCHPDRSVEAMVTDMERLFGKRYDRGALLTLYGDLSQNVLLATLRLGKAHEQAPAIAVLGESRRLEAVPLLVPLLAHPLPILRFFVRDALAAIAGKPASFDLHQDNAKIIEEATLWLQKSGVQIGSSATVAPTAGTTPTRVTGNHDEE